MQRHYVYEIKDILTGEFYWGSRTCGCDPKEDPYMGSMITWKPKKINLVKSVIIEYDTRKEATLAEKIIVKFYRDKQKFPLNRNYNIPGGIFCTAGKKFSENEIFNLKIRLKGKKQSLQHRKNNADSRRGKHLSEERKKKISESEKGKKLSIETKIKIKESRLGICIKQRKIKCPHCEKEGGASAMRQHHFDNCPVITGKSHRRVSEDTKQKISNSLKKRYGKL